MKFSVFLQPRLTRGTHAEVAESVDASVSKTDEVTLVPVRSRPSVPKEKRLSYKGRFFVVPKAGIEPARVLPHRFLRPTRLPIPPLRHGLIASNAAAKVRKILFSASNLRKISLFASTARIKCLLLQPQKRTYQWQEDTFPFSLVEPRKN